MPEVHVSQAADAERKLSILSAGIGDSDMFPLLDNGSDEETYVHPEEKKWGFRITGGAEFKMPVVVFQVTEGSLADKSGIKLGDIIVKINGIEATCLTLAEARKVVQQADNTLEIIAQKMEDENETGVEEKNIVLRQPIELAKQSPPRAHLHDKQADLQEKLATLQRKLAAIAEIPNLLRSTLETVSKTVENFVPAEFSNDFVNQYEDDDYQDHSFADCYVLDENTIDDANEITDDSESFDHYYYEDSLDPVDSFNEVEEELESEEEQEQHNEVEVLPDLEASIKEPTPEPTEEELQKREKKQKMLELERSWPWEDSKKVVHKFSSRRIVPSISMVKERVHQFNEIPLSGRSTKNN